MKKKLDNHKLYNAIRWKLPTMEQYPTRGLPPYYDVAKMSKFVYGFDHRSSERR